MQQMPEVARSTFQIHGCSVSPDPGLSRRGTTLPWPQQPVFFRPCVIAGLRAHARGGNLVMRLNIASARLENPGLFQFA
jgi:hypothetical protein